ncbi:MAG TPA: ATP-binding protein [Bryobacteraceae bacterium]|nr:ATP-binding protein [Bryobacteraceae bacterium]
MTSNHRTLASRFSIFTSLLLVWVVATALLWDLIFHTFSIWEGIVLVMVVPAVALAISWFTIKVLTRPLALLQQGITSVREGKFEPIQVSETHDEIEDLGKSFNRMIEELQRTNREIQQHRDLLEERILQRTEELENAMRTALEASQAKSDFLANMSHELRTPMNGLLGMLDVVLDSHVDGEQRDHLETARRSAYSLLALLNDILDLSKIEAGRMMIEEIPFNLRTVLEDCVKSYQARAHQKRIALHFEMHAAAPSTVLGDPLRLRQIVTNLLSNAIKFTDQGFVAVEVKSAPRAERPGEAQVCIQVRDTGTGIDQDKLVTIFDKFTQADGSITRKYGGTGLGLAITKRLTELQGGSVTVESSPGLGSTFTISLPYQIVPEPAPHAAESAPSVAALDAGLSRPARILLVEDNVVNQKVVLAVLRKKKYHIEVAGDGREALDMLQASEPYDLLLMDIQMPVLDGLETTRLIRKDPRWVALPILAMTAHAMTGDRERCMQAGMNGYISKPIQPAHLIATIAESLATAPAPPALTGSESTEGAPYDDTGMVGDLLRVFLQLAPARIERLENAARDHDGRTIAIEAKKIAAAAEQLAIPHLGECAIRIEMAGYREDFDGIAEDLDLLRQEIQSLEAALA